MHDRPVNLMIDACQTGGGGVITQGNTHRFNVIAFWSGKFNCAQQNYPVHKRELLAIVESLKRYRHLLMGITFYIYTDHKPIECLMTQKHLSARQQCWVDILSEFSFEIKYIPGELNIFADALSRIYSNEPIGIVRAESEYIHEDDAPNALVSLQSLSRPLLTGPAAAAEIELQAAATTRSFNENQISDTRLQRSRRTRRPTCRHDDVGMRGIAVLPVSEAARMKLMTDTKTKDVCKRTRTIPQKTVTHPLPVQVHAVPNTNDMSEIAYNEDGNLNNLPPLIDEDMAPELHLRCQDHSIDVDGPSFTEVVSMFNPNIVFPRCLKEYYTQDSFFQKIINDPFSFSTFKIRDGLIYLLSKGQDLLCIPDGKIEGSSIRETVISHVHSLLAHLSGRKTFHYLHNNVWWPRMYDDITTYCKSCHTCATGKPRNQK